VGDPVLDHLMEELGKHLNLRKHLVGKQRVEVVGPGDIEGHLGTDGRYYLLDYARLMPPETPLPDEEGNMDGRGVFFRMLRPELVRGFRVPLSSDTFTGWGMYDDNRVAYEMDVREATDRMTEECIPELAEEISQLYQEGLCDGLSITPAKMQEIVEQLNLVARMHSRGVNLRHLGRLRQRVDSERGHRLILSMALSRAFKSKLRKRMRYSVQNQKHTGVSSESACKDVVLHFFNSVLGHTDESDRFWRVSIKKTLKKKFPFILTAEEEHEDYDLRKAGCIKLTFMMSFKLGLVQFPSAVTEAIFRDYTSVRLVETDILSIPATIKHSHLTHIFNGNICMFEAAKGNHMSSDALRLLRQAREHLVTATNMSPSCPYANWVLGSIEVDIASRLLFDQEAERLFTTAYVRFETSYKLDKENRGPLDSWADGLEEHATRLEANNGDVGRIEEMRALAKTKRSMAAAAVGVTSCPLLTMRNAAT
jgi:ribosomal protein S17